LALLGLAAGIAGWRLLPAAPGRLDYAIEVADPRPVAEATMPDGLRAFHATRALAIDLQEGPGPSRFLLVDAGARMLSSSDIGLGKLPDAAVERTASGPPAAMAGTNTGLTLGRATVGGIELRIVAVLHHLGPFADSSIIMLDTPSTLLALGPLSEKATARYLLLTATPGERSRALETLRSEASPLPPDSEVISPETRLPVARPIRVALAAVFICCGALAIGLQVRKLGRDGIAQRFSRG